MTREETPKAGASESSSVASSNTASSSIELADRSETGRRALLTIRILSVAPLVLDLGELAAYDGDQFRVWFYARHQ